MVESTLPAFDDAHALAAVLDLMPVGVVLTDASARPLWMNLEARLLLGRGEGLALRGGRLVVTSGESGCALASLLKRAIDPGAADAEAILLPRAPESAPLVVVVRPLEAPGPRSARAVLFVSDPDQGLRASRARLRQLFDLTPTEADLVGLLSDGHDLRSAGDRLGIRHETARTHVKNVFIKTGVRRQSQLVRLALAAATAGALGS
jgi:DNA-binding CsgD family transcriptional regulator